MADNSKIEWTDTTWNPVTGCSKVSQGCKNCYAERDWARLSAPRPKPNIYTGRAFTDVRVHPERLTQPLLWTRPRRIFVNSMSDLFHDDVSDEFIATVFGIMAASQRHIFQVLTKRPDRMLAWFDKLRPDPRYLMTAAVAQQSVNYPRDLHLVAHWPLRNVWIGVSVEDQETADKRIPLLLQSPAAVRWISAEPLIGQVRLDQIERTGDDWTYIDNALTGFRATKAGGVHGNKIDWVVAGGESGPHARPTHPAWIRQMRDQCTAAGVPFFFKQWGEWHPCETEVHADERGCEIYPHDENLFGDYTKTSGKAFEVIQHDGQEFFKAGKKLSGRVLDGRTWDEYPRSE